MPISSRRGLTALITGSALIGSFALTGTAFAAGPTPGAWAGRGGAGMARPAVVGTVATAPDARGTFTVTAKAWKRKDTTDANTAPSTTYTVTATSATIVLKDGSASTVSAIAVGDRVMVRGTVTDTTVTAATINDGAAFGRPGQRPESVATPAITGNGEPIIGGNVAAVSGDSITVTNQSNLTYTVDVTNATVTKPGVTSATTANIAVGDRVVVQGTVNGTSVTASSVIDQGTPPSTASGTTPAHGGGFFGAIGGFFAHLFGF
ncbi:MAG: hypothetical protein B7W98_00575 [Parcubacteria group bacterium 20-58-5]|nr:MAG: hypothetical protein B7W98_00575 [Parcubacteria group bacterium 20-58-5]OYV63744.1 MAG: hypothetical protein B7X03_00690 [Parcubacteria group bacterium 21-58-10]OYV83090.1 MAG: hypothetical protein B7W96_00730 [Parcubacteria group bacterium 37-58-5]HQT82724.1 DUF5666 domain-containing protein [Candidatus Paceibacterota bacterium]